MRHPILITTSDIRRCHPQGLNCDTDVDYANFANKLVRLLQLMPDLNVWDATYLKTIALKITMYFEDLVAEVGLWKSFTDKHAQLYGHPLPFFSWVEDYSVDAPRPEDVLYLIWDALLELQEERIPNPMNPALKNAAMSITSLLQAQFDDIPINEQLYDFFHEARFCDDFYQLRQVLKWVYFDCYVTKGRFTDYYYEQKQDFYRDTLGTGPRDTNYGAECLIPFNQKIGPLALEPREWLAQFLRTAGRTREAAEVETVESTEVEPFLLKHFDADAIELEDWQERTFPVRRTEMFKVSDALLSRTDINGCIGTFARYRDEWFLNGVNSWGDIIKPMQQYREHQQQMKSVGIPNYQHLMELSGGSPLFYFASKEELYKFQSAEMGMPEDSFDLPTKARIKNIVLFIPEESGSFGYMINNAEVLCDPRNPFYNKKVAEREAFNFITFVEDNDPQLIRYAVNHGLLPDARMNSILGEEHGHALVQQNLDFLARTLRRQEY